MFCSSRCLLSYQSLFFKEERARLLAKINEGVEDESGGDKDDSSNKKKKRRGSGSGNRIGFENLAKIVGSRWQSLSANEVQYYKDLAADDMQRYKKEMAVYLSKNAAKEEAEAKEDAEAAAKMKGEATSKGSDNAEDQKDDEDAASNDDADTKSAGTEDEEGRAAKKAKLDIM